ncbi:hypothetical protein [Methanosarcina lacustris]|uniref:hypothetical protein n=1 Tax=Methanosarcina lacustris TaxID=170861 RepID=UPI00064F7F63|nr:hypothetical protein [Methanosarcina lacustris]
MQYEFPIGLSARSVLPLTPKNAFQFTGKYKRLRQLVWRFCKKRKKNKFVLFSEDRRTVVREELITLIKK